MSDQKKLNAVRQFAQRKDYSSLLQRVDTHGGHAGYPKYHYCRHCGTPTEVLTGDSVFDSYSECSQCRGLDQNGWIEDANRHYEGQ